MQLQRNDTVPLPMHSRRAKPFTTLESAGECAKLTETCNERFKKVKSEQTELNIFVTSFDVGSADVPDYLQEIMWGRHRGSLG